MRQGPGPFPSDWAPAGSGRLRAGPRRERQAPICLPRTQARAQRGVCVCGRGEGREAARERDCGLAVPGPGVAGPARAD